MDFQSELEVRQQLARYFNNECSLREFEDWFVPRSWNFKAATLPLQKLVSEIELYLAEFSNGDWTVEELKNHLKPLVTHYTLEYRTDDNIFISTGSSSSNALEFPPIDLQRSFDIQALEASA
jgi:hypothetical protein